MIKLVATDIDGTLIRESSSVLPEEIFDLIRELRKRDIYFAAASGRQYMGLKRLFAPVADQMLFISANDEDGTKLKVIKMSLYCESGIRHYAKEIEDYWQGRLNTVVAGAPWIDFMKPGTDKGAALQFVQQYFQVKKEETLAFGDNHNDLGMILAAGEGCAVSTARTAVKEAAKHIVGSYEEKGVIKALQELLKKQK